MTFCEHCGEKIGYLPFKCKYCGGTYCKKHRLPENHDCSFELKHVPVVPTTTRDARPRYQDATSERDYEYKMEKQRRRYLKQRERQMKRAARGMDSSLPGTGQAKGTNIIIIMIVIFSITTTILAIFGLSHLIAFSLWGVLNLFLWTIITALFISYSASLFGLFFLLILIMFLYNIAKNIEIRFGTKFLIGLYIFCAAFTALFYILIRLLLGPIYPIGIIIIPVGLATGAIIGLISFIVYFNPNREMMMFCYFVPLKMKGKTLLIVLILFRLIPGLLFGYFYGPIQYCYYFPDLGGMIGAYIVFRSKYKSR